MITHNTSHETFRVRQLLNNAVLEVFSD